MIWNYRKSKKTRKHLVSTHIVEKLSSEEHRPQSLVSMLLEMLPLGWLSLVQSFVVEHMAPPNTRR